MDAITKDVYLKTPNLSSDFIIGAKTGIRPFGKKGMRLETAYFKNKMIIHSEISAKVKVLLHIVSPWVVFMNLKFRMNK